MATLSAAAHSDHQHAADDSLLARAVAAQSHHDFDLALALVDRALADNPHDDAARLQQMALHLIRGEPDAAHAACKALRSVPITVVITCHARVAHARGASGRVRARLERLLELPGDAHIDNEHHGWSLGVAGDLALADGDAAAARRHYARALAAFDNHQVRASLVDVLIDARDWSAAKAVVSEGRRSLTLTVQGLIIDRALGVDRSRFVSGLARQFARMEADGHYEHAREMARFYLDVAEQPERALVLARINASLQHEPEDRQLLARAAAAAR